MAIKYTRDIKYNSIENYFSLVSADLMVHKNCAPADRYGHADRQINVAPWTITSSSSN